LDGFLHAEGGVASAHSVVLMGDGGPEQGHDAIAHDLVHRPLVAVHRCHHVLHHRVEELARLLRVTVGKQLHRALQGGKQYRDLFPFPFQGGARGEDFFCQMRRDSSAGRWCRRSERWGGGCGRGLQGGRTFPAELEPGRILEPAVRAAGLQRRGTLATELHALRVLKATVRTAHGLPPSCWCDGVSTSDVLSHRDGSVVRYAMACVKGNCQGAATLGGYRGLTRVLCFATLGLIESSHVFGQPSCTPPRVAE